MDSMKKPPRNSNRTKKLIRARMKETGQKYTAAMRDILAEQEAAAAAEKEAEDAAGN